MHMGFIERLKQQSEVEVLARNQREAELSKKGEIEEATRQEKEAREREFHEQRRQQAETYYRQSGVDVLFSDFKKILEDSGRLDSEVIPLDSGKEFTFTWKGRDPDRVTLQPIFWDRKIRRNICEGNVSSGYSYDVCEGKFLQADVLPEGNVVFYGQNDAVVSLMEWRNNKDLIENALENAFSNPGKHIYRVNSKSWDHLG